MTTTPSFPWILFHNHATGHPILFNVHHIVAIYEDPGMPTANIGKKTIITTSNNGGDFYVKETFAAVLQLISAP